MRITTWNVNGLRAAVRKGFLDHVERLSPDVLLLQEVRATPDQLPPEVAEPAGWHAVWHPAERPGYAGTAVWSRRPVAVVGTGLGKGDRDRQGRVIRVAVDGGRERLEVASVYLPSGSSSDTAQARKEAWMRRFRPWATKRRVAAARRPFVFGGDLNIAHTERDIFYAKGNAKNSGFLPHERAWFSRLLKSGWDDLVRRWADRDGPVQGPYSWWSNRGRARELDRGWRIDYLLANAAASPRLIAASTDRETGLTVSDHAAVSVDLDL